MIMAADDDKKRQVGGGPPPSLLHLTTQIVATNIEKYPAGLWGVLSESQWDQIVRARVAQKKQQQTRPPSSSSVAATGNNNDDATATTTNSSSPKKKPDVIINNVTLLLPPLSAKHLTLIEQHPHNTHLSHSTTADELLWKHILNYKFRESSNVGGMNMNRPASLSVPCKHVERQLKECADTLINLVEMKSCSYNQFVADEEPPNDDDKLLFGEDDDDSDNDEKETTTATTTTTTDNTDEAMHHKYLQFMKQLAHIDLEILKRTCYTLSESPMDVQLLTETKIGKSVSKAVKTLTKLKKKCEDENRGFCDGVGEDVELREIFWKRIVKWNGPIICYTSTAAPPPPPPPPSVRGNSNDSQRDRRELVESTSLELLQKLLDDWKEMASDSGVAMRSSNTVDNATAASAASVVPPKKKRRMDEDSKNNQHDNTNKQQQSNSNHKYTNNNIRVTNCGRDKHISFEQHQTDMKLLHNSPDWRSLYVSLTNRELELRKSHGEKVRATREHLERDRPKIGKVILKRAVGRVRGGDVGLGGGSVGLLLRRDGSGGGGGEQADLLSSSQVSTNIVGGGAATTTATKLATFAAERKASRQEAILNKSKGLRAIQKQRAMLGGSTSSTTKVAQIRQTSKVAAKWSKSSFGNSVASVAAGSKSGGVVRKVGMRKDQASQVQVTLQNGKTMKLPSTASWNVACGTKSTGKFSSLQEKMAAKNRAVKKRK